MFNFYLPCFYTGTNLNFVLIELMQKYPERFYDGVKIGAFYDAFPRQKWNGGREDLLNTPFTSDQMDELIGIYTDYGVKIRFTYTNCMIRPEDLEDAYCNECTRIANKYGCGIIINSKLLEDYLRKTYANLTYISSTTKCITDFDDVCEELKHYDMVVLDYNFYDDPEAMWCFPNKDKLEIILDDQCIPHCPNRRAHYKSTSLIQLGIQAYGFKCPYPPLSTFEDLKSTRAFIDLKTLYGKLIPMGYKNFKLVGRNMHPADLIESYVYYLVKPEWVATIRNLLLKACF